MWRFSDATRKPQQKNSKILLEIGGRSVLDWQLNLLKEVGVKETILASGHLHNLLCEHVGVYREGMHIRYAKENKKLGTGGAISNAMKHIHTFPFFVLNGDVLVTDFSLETCEHIQDAMEMIRQTVRSLGNHPCIETPIDGLSVRFLTDGCPSDSDSLEYDSWRFNLRESNTEPLLRLNVETISNEHLLIEKTMKISEELESIGGKRETKFRWEPE